VGFPAWRSTHGFHEAFQRCFIQSFAFKPMPCTVDRRLLSFSPELTDRAIESLTSSAWPTVSKSIQVIRGIIGQYTEISVDSLFSRDFLARVFIFLGRPISAQTSDVLQMLADSLLFASRESLLPVLREDLLHGLLALARLHRSNPTEAAQSLVCLATFSHHVPDVTTLLLQHEVLPLLFTVFDETAFVDLCHAVADHDCEVATAYEYHLAE
jgi:hypothetical protein